VEQHVGLSTDQVSAACGVFALTVTYPSGPVWPLSGAVWPLGQRMLPLSRIPVIDQRRHSRSYYRDR
ncbi:MAG: hypothetical protein M3325_14960, partial [Actinomycetota bacterium]|nr:hypothetical protein [Actinomycetota bacterium]